MNDLIRYAAEKWSLSDLHTIYEHSAKAVYCAESQTFGSVILKWDSSCTQLQSEYHMLNRLDGASACRVYDFDAENGLLLEERILPGTVLRKEPSLERRIEAFGKVFRAVHSNETEGETYLDWLRSIDVYCKTNPVETELTDMTAAAYAVCAEIFAKYPDRVLLHGDLHHDNLLLRPDGSYAMIDPKGVVGPALLDLPRFILNETDTIHAKTNTEHIAEVIFLLSKHLGYPQDDVRKLYFMEVVLANMWSYEDGEPVNHEELALAKNILSKLVQT